MNDDFSTEDTENEERTVGWMRRGLFALGLIFSVVGVIRQWPIIGKTYMEFIEGNGYLPLMLGLIMIVLGFSVRLLIGAGNEKTHE